MRSLSNSGSFEYNLCGPALPFIPSLILLGINIPAQTLYIYPGYFGQTLYLCMYLCMYVRMYGQSEDLHSKLLCTYCPLPIYAHVWPLREALLHSIIDTRYPME